MNFIERLNKYAKDTIANEEISKDTGEFVLRVIDTITKDSTGYTERLQSKYGLDKPYADWVVRQELIHVIRQIKDTAFKHEAN